MRHMLCGFHLAIVELVSISRDWLDAAPNPGDRDRTTTRTPRNFPTWGCSRESRSIWRVEQLFPYRGDDSVDDPVRLAGRCGRRPPGTVAVAHCTDGDTPTRSLIRQFA